jgi:ferredoxin
MGEKYLQIGDACSGCMACYAQCPFGAISVEERQGFYYPKIDYAVCKHCGKCEKACPVIGFQKGKKGEWTPVQEASCYIGWHLNPEVRRVSSSGGIFTACAEQILEEDGVVCGAIYDENMVIRHVAIEKGADLEPLRRSKYAQSDTSKIFGQVKGYLDNDRKVLFCGTPCQVAALRWNFPREKYPRLILISLACMAVASPVVFRHYVAWIEKRYGDKMTELAFRTKKYGWTVGMKIATFKHLGERTLILKESFFMRGFLKDNLIGPACPGCPFRAGSSGADITLGDFWGCSRFYPGAYGKKHRLGFSGIVVYTEEGKRLVENKGKAFVEPVPLHELLDYNKGWLPKVKLQKTAREFLEKFKADPSMRFIDRMLPVSLKEFIVTWERHLSFGHWFPISRDLYNVRRAIRSLFKR